MSAQRDDEPTPIEKARGDLDKSERGFRRTRGDSLMSRLRRQRWIGPVEVIFLAAAAVIAGALSYVGPAAVLLWIGLVLAALGAFVYLAGRDAA